MARYVGPQCRLCRTENTKLFLKGERCYSAKCPIAKKANPPGKGPRFRAKKMSDYGTQLRQKQKLKRIFGISGGCCQNICRKFFEHFVRVMSALLPRLAVQHLEKHSGAGIPAPPQIFSQITQPLQPFWEIGKFILSDAHFGFSFFYFAATTRTLFRDPKEFKQQSSF